MSRSILPSCAVLNSGSNVTFILSHPNAPQITNYYNDSIKLVRARNAVRQGELGRITWRGVWLSTIHLMTRFRASGQLSYSHILYVNKGYNPRAGSAPTIQYPISNIQLNYLIDIFAQIFNFLKTFL